MRIPILVPDFQLGPEPLRLGEWAVAVGDEIEQGECLTELICPGFAVELLSPADGLVVELLRYPEQSVRVGDVLGWLENRIATATPECLE